MDVEKECALRIHIRKLLFRYSLTHLTIDYLTYTHTEVSEVLSDCLHAVPLDEPTSLVLPVEPFEALSEMLGIKVQKPYDQTWTIADETYKYMFTDMLGKGHYRELPTKRCWKTDNETTYTSPYRFMTPILTTRAIRQTPRIGSSSSSALIRSCRRDSEYLEHVNIKHVADEVIEDVLFSVREQDHILNLRQPLDKATLGDIMTLLARVTDPQHQSKSPNGTLPFMVSDFLRDKASSFVDPLCPMSPPIFPRQLEGTSVLSMGGPSEIHSLGFVAPVDVDDEVEDMSKAHMLLVDGWNVMAPPPTSQSISSNTPSLEAASQSSQTELDELFALTPPQQSLMGLITGEKMEEYLVPQSHKPGGGGKMRQVEPKQSLATFLPPLLPSVSENCEPNTPDPLHRSPTASLSILGQPPSPVYPSIPHQSIVDQLMVEKRSSSLGVGLDALITQLCAPVEGQSAEDFIMHERIGEKEALMMDVPKLKEPYLRPNSPSGPVPPTSIRTLVSSRKHKSHSSKKTDVDEPSSIYIKKVAGVQSLNIELPWRPFNYGTSIPSTEELADVEHHPKLNSQPGLNPTDGDAENELKNLLALEPGTDTEEFFGANLCDEPAIDWAATLGEDRSRYDVIWTRAERWRVSGHHRSCISEDVTARKETFEEDWDEVESPTRYHKRRKVVSMSDSNVLDDSEVQRDIDPVQDVDGVRFSFNTLCSPGQELLSQARSEDAPYWNHAGDTPYSEALPVGGLEFLDHHADPVWTAEAAVQAASLVNVPHPDRTNLSAGTIVDNQTRSPPVAQAISPQIRLPIQSLDLVLPDHGINRSAALPVPPKAMSRLSNIHRSEKVAAQEALTNFMTLRGKAAYESITIFSSQPEPELPVDITSSPPRPVPTELTDANTLSLPEEWIPPPSRHRYIASLDVLQKTILLRHLTSLDCNVELVERDNTATNGVDLIIDSDTALLFVPLSPLPVSGEALSEKVAKLSWDFARLVIVFEAFSTSLSYRPDKSDSGAALTPYAFSPAIVKALRKFKRTLAILDGMATGNKRRDMEMRYAYARDVGEASRFARLVGDMAENASAAVLEDGREWLTDEYHEDELDLAQIKGMNVYAARMILRYVNFNTFIDMEPQSRVKMFSAMVGAQRITMFNEVIANRLTLVATSSSPPLSPAAQSTTSSFKPVPEIFEDTSCYGRYVEIAGEREDSNYHYGRRSVQEDAIEWQTTGLLMIPGKGKHTASDDPVDYSM